MEVDRRPLLERAYELARSGACRGLSDIRLALKAEGYSQTQDILLGLGLKRHLQRLCKEAALKHLYATTEDRGRSGAAQIIVLKVPADASTDEDA